MVGIRGILQEQAQATKYEIRESEKGNKHGNDLQHGNVRIEQIEHQISKQIGAEIGRNELGEIEYSENHKFHTMDVKLTVAVLSMYKYREMTELISDLTNDNAEMLETIESLQESLEKASRENESLRFRVSDLEFIRMCKNI